LGLKKHSRANEEKNLAAKMRKMQK